MGETRPSDQFDNLRRQAEEVLRRQPAATPEKPTDRPIRVLYIYIDDYRPDRMLVRHALQEEAGQFHLTEAASRAEFEARFAEGAYDLVLTDFDIGDFDGLQVLETVRARSPHLPVVIATGSEQVERAVEAMKRGAADYVIKSVEHIRRLPHTIRAALEHQTLLHELQVHQIELEMQNEELRRAQVELTLARDRYLDLYDFAPVGYVTLGEEGIIRQANLTLAAMLGVNRGDLVRLPLSRFTFQEDQDLYHRRRRQLFQSREPQACELRMVRQDGSPFWARLEATLAESGVLHGAEGDGSLVRVTIGDITERARVEEALQRSSR